MAAVLEGLVLIPVPGQAGRLPPAMPATALAAGNAYLIPLTEEVRTRIHQADYDADPVEGFYQLTSGIARWARELSQQWLTLYVHCEFFGGGGIQAAVAWHQESVIFGPRFTRTHDEPEGPPYQAAQRQEMAINQGLRALGIHAVSPDDEFVTIGLDRHRWTDDWVTEPSQPS